MKNLKKQKNICPVCGGHDLILLTERQIPPFQNKLFTSFNEAVNVNKVFLSMVVCGACGFVFNRTYDTEINRYDTDYCNDQEASSIFKKHRRNFTEFIYQNYLQPHDIILEVGCGFNGNYLKEFVQYASVPCKGVGYDPSFIGESFMEFPQEDGSVRQVNYYAEYFTQDSFLCEEPNIVIARHLIEHLPDPTILLKNFSSLESSPVFCIETPDVSWIFDNVAWYDFFDEHCSLFSDASIMVLLRSFGLEVLEIKHVFGGQYMQIFAKESKSDFHLPSLADSIELLLQKAKKYQKLEQEKMFHWYSLISNKKEKGNCVIWGGGAKGNTFLNLFDPERAYISFVIDINPQKWGKFIAGTGHQIYPPEEIAHQNISTIFIMNPNYKDEIQETLKQLSIKNIEIIPL